MKFTDFEVVAGYSGKTIVTFRVNDDQGGFDVRRCPEPQALAEFLVRAAKNHYKLIHLGQLLLDRFDNRIATAKNSRRDPDIVKALEHDREQTRLILVEAGA